MRPASSFSSLLACIGTNAKGAREIIRKTSRLADRLNATWQLLYVQTSAETTTRINLADQRHLINNFQLATELGGQLIKVKSDDIAEEVLRVVKENRITLVVFGVTSGSIWERMFKKSITNQIISTLAESDTDADVYLVNY